MIILLALLSQDPIIDFEKYKAAYEPYRRCVLSAAKSRYPSGESFTSIYQAAERECLDKRIDFSSEALLIEIDRIATENRSRGQWISDELGAAFDQELLLQLAEDFVPKEM